MIEYRSLCVIELFNFILFLHYSFNTILNTAKTSHPQRSLNRTNQLSEHASHALSKQKQRATIIEDDLYTKKGENLSRERAHLKYIFARIIKDVKYERMNRARQYPQCMHDRQRHFARISASAAAFYDPFCLCMRARVYFRNDKKRHIDERERERERDACVTTKKIGFMEL